MELCFYTELENLATYSPIDGIDFFLEEICQPFKNTKPATLNL